MKTKLIFLSLIIVLMLGTGVLACVYRATHQDILMNSYKKCLAAKGSLVQVAYPTTCTFSDIQFSEPIFAPTDRISNWNTYHGRDLSFSFPNTFITLDKLEIDGTRRERDPYAILHLSEGDNDLKLIQGFTEKYLTEKDTFIEESNITLGAMQLVIKEYLTPNTNVSEHISNSQILLVVSFGNDDVLTFGFPKSLYDIEEQTKEKELFINIIRSATFKSIN